MKINKQIIHTIFTTCSQLVVLFLFLSVLTATQVQSAYSYYDKNLVFSNSDIYSLPEHFNSIEKIQSFLASKGSVLASQNVALSLYKNSAESYLLNSREAYDPGSSYTKVENKVVSFSEFVWLLSRTSFGSGCSSDFPTVICFDNGKKPMNPGFILSIIQKESRLVYGACAKPDADTNTSCQPYSQPSNINKLQFRLDRATGYYCFETNDKSKGCWDENPNWIIYKGLFRQVYHMVRRLRILEQMCIKGGVYSFKNSNGDYYVGNTLYFDGIPVLFGNGITCALYIYTPHVSDLTWKIMKDLDSLFVLGQNYNIYDGYKPKPLHNPENNSFIKI